MRYVEARAEETSRDEAYRFYVAKSLQLIPQSKYISVDLKNILNPEKVDNRNADEIASEVMKNAGLKFG